MSNSNEGYTQEELERIDAVNRYHRGERSSKIYRSLGKSRSWLQKTKKSMKRFQNKRLNQEMTC